MNRGAMTLLKTIMILWIGCTAIFSADSLDELESWKKAQIALQLLHSADIKKNIVELNEKLKEKIAPAEFKSLRPVQYESEQKETFKKRKLVHSLLCKVGWQGTLFLLASKQTFEDFFGSGDTPFRTPTPLFGKKSFLEQHFKNFESTIGKGYLGAFIWFISSREKNNRDWQSNFADGLLNYCNSHGFGEFAQFVLDHTELFLKGNRQMRHQQKNWLAQSFIVAFTTDLKKRGTSLLETEEKMKILEKFQPDQTSVILLYTQAAKLNNYTLMDRMLASASWPKPSVEAKNYALDLTLNRGNYVRAEEMLSANTGKKPSINVVEAFTAKKARENQWKIVKEALNLFSRLAALPSQNLIDALYVCAAAHGNQEYLTLLTVGSSNPKPSQKAKDDGLVHAYMNQKEAILDRLEADATNAAFDRSLLECVKYRHQSLFDRILGTHLEKLSTPGMRAALEQAEKPLENKSLFIAYESSIFDNHYAKHLKEKLGIPLKMYEFSVDSFKYTSHIELYNLDLSNLYVPINYEILVPAGPS